MYLITINRESFKNFILCVSVMIVLTVLLFNVWATTNPDSGTERSMRISETLSSFWFDDFPNSTLDSNIWSVVSGTPSVNTNGSNEPSPPYSLNLDGTDAVETKPIDLSGKQSVVLSLYYQNSGTERGDDLVLKFYYNNYWFDLKRYSGETPTGTSSYVKEQIPIPVFAYSNEFKLKLETECDSDYDDWYVDDISLYLSPDIDVSPNKFNVSLNLEDSTTQTLTIGNKGEGDLEFDLSISYQSGLSKSIQQILVANEAVPRGDFSHVKVDGMDDDPPLLKAVSYTANEIFAVREKYQVSSNLVRVCVLDSWGSDHGGACWDYLNANWGEFGSTEIVVDYSTLNIDNITYTDIVNSQADVLILSDAHAYWEYTSEELAAIKQYVEEGHGLYVSDASFYDEIPLRQQVLCPLLGLNGGINYTPDNSTNSIMNFVNPYHPILYNISSPYQTYNSNYIAPEGGGDWNTAITTGEIIAISDDKNCAVIVNSKESNRVYISSIPEYQRNTEDYQFLYNTIVWCTGVVGPGWLSLDPREGTVLMGESKVVIVTFRTKEILPDSTYQASITVASNDPDEPSISVPAILTVNPVNYYVDVVHTPEDSAGARGETITYHVSVKNLGSLSDRYNLSASGNLWPTTIWNAAGTSQISNTGTVASKASVNILVKVMVPANAEYHATDSATLTVTSVGDPSVSDFVVLNSYVEKPVNELPFVENFESTTLDINIWTNTTGSPEINTEGENEPSSPYSLELSGTESVSSLKLKLQGKTDVRLEYYHQNDNTESGDDLVVSCYTPGYWIELFRHNGNDAELSSYQKNIITIPAFALTDSFRVRFSSTCDSYSDEWFVDNICIYVPPEISITSTPSPLNFTLSQGDSSTGTLTITNNGESDLEFSLNFAGTAQPKFGKKRSSQKKMEELKQLVERLNERATLGTPSFSQQTSDELFTSFTQGKSENGPAAYTAFKKMNSSGLNVGILGAESSESSLSDVRRKVLSLGFFTSVTTINVNSFTPSLSDLLALDAVIVWSFSAFADATNLANNLAAYVDAGGGVVVAGTAWGNAPVSVTQLHADFTRYHVIIPEYETVWGPQAYLGTVHVPNHPIMHGITSFNGGPESLRPKGDITSGALRIADWSDGRVLVAVKVINGHRRADLGFYPVSSDVKNCGWVSSTDGAQLIANSLLWVCGAGASNWLSFSSTADTLTPGKSTDIQVTVRSQGLVPDSTYYGAIIIESNAASSPDSVLASLTVNALPYYFELSSTHENKSGIPGQTVQCSFTVTNRGKNPDSYVLSIAGNKWPTTTWNQSGTSQISTIPLLNPKASYTFMTKTQVPNDQFFGVKDSVNIQLTSSGNSAFKKSIKIVTTSEWRDNFETTVIDTNKWNVVSGTPTINSEGESEPSEPYSLELNGSSSIESKSIDLRVFAGRKLYLSFYWQNDNTESSDDLVVRIFQGTYWIELLRLSGETYELSTYTPQMIEIPEFAFEQDFKIQFKTECDYSSDEWFIDDVFLTDSTSTGMEEYVDYAIPNTFHLYQNYPNPFNPTTSIKYDIPKLCSVKLQIYNALGKHIQTLLDGRKPAGSYIVQWNGKDMNGDSVASGLYFYRIIANDFVKVRKLMLLK